MNFKTTYLLFAVLAAFVAVLTIALWRGGGTGAEDAHHVMAGMHDSTNPFKPDDITRVVIERKSPEGPDLVFERDPGSKDWRITSPRAYPADSGNVQNLIQQVYDARPEKDDKPKDLKAGGLDSPRRVVTLHGSIDGKDREAKLFVGASTPGTESAVVFVASSDNPSVPHAVRKTDLSAVLEPLAYFRSRDLLSEGTGEVQAVKLTEGNKVVELKKDKDRWRLVQPPYGDAEIGPLLTNLNDLRVNYKDEKDNDFVADDVTDLAKYHLAGTAKEPVLRIEVTGSEKDKKPVTKTLVVGVGKKLEDKKKDSKEEKYYAYLDTGRKAKDVVKVSASAVEPFRKLLDDPGAMRNKNLVQLEAFHAPDAIDVQNSYGKLEFRKADSAGRWKLYRDGTAHDVDETEVNLLRDTLTKKDQVQSFPDPKRRGQLGLDRKDVDVVTVWADSLEKPDKKDKKDAKPKFRKGAKPAAVLRFGGREGKLVAVERAWGDDRTLVMVPESVLDVVRKGPLAYLDKSLPQFNPNDLDAGKGVTRLVLEKRGGTAYELAREKDGPWKFVKPTQWAGREADADVVQEVLSALNRLRAVEVAAEGAKKEDLAGYDLGARPAFRAVVTVTKEGKPAPFEYRFGKSTKAGVYAKVQGKGAVYVVGSDILSTLQKELRDTTVLKFDPDRVRGLRLRGWYKQAGEELTLAVERKDGGWVATVPPKFRLDSEKVNTFLRDLSNLQATRFVTSGKGMTIPEGALEVEVTVEGHKGPLQLTVGGEDGARHYFAASRQRKGEAFTLPKETFEEVKKGRGYFSK
jgi:hypothetical protein